MSLPQCSDTISVRKLSREFQELREFVKRQREAREHDAWFRAKVQEAIDDPRPGIPHDVVLDETRAIIDRIVADKV